MSTIRSTNDQHETGSQEIAAASSVCSQVDPDLLNESELKKYYSLEGFLGGTRLKARLFMSYVLQRLADNPPHPRLTTVYQRMRGVHIGEHVYIGPHVSIDFLYPQLVTIEDYVSIGMNSMIFAHSNPTCSVWLKLNRYPRSVAPVTIKNGAWIPPGVIILPGVTIGENSVVGAGSLVTRDVEPFTLVAGCPAKFVKRLDS
jgi:acetyltransferase-like isoleucine patch superfamily enzyme